MTLSLMKGERMSVDPKLALFLSTISAMLSALSVPEINSLGFASHSETILAWLLVGNGVLNAFLHAYASTTPGPLAPADPPKK